MRLSAIATASFLTLAIPLPGIADLLGPSNYDECILESMKGVTSDQAASFIVLACANKFLNKPKENPQSRALSYKELSRLAGKADATSTLFSGNLYNGNSNITVSEITIQVTTTIGGEKITRMYRDDVVIRPQTAAGFQFSIVIGDNDADYSWDIHSAKGY